MTASRVERPGAITLVPEASHRRLEDALLQSADRLRRQFKALPVPTYTWQRIQDDFVLIDYNDAAKTESDGDVTGYVGARASSVYESSPGIFEDLTRAFNERTTIEREMSYTIPRRGGTFDLHVTYVFLPPDLVMVHVQNITKMTATTRELERTVEALRTREEERQVLMERLAHAQEEERTRIAEDIHDDPIQALTAVALRIASLSQNARDPEQRAAFGKLEETVDHAIDRLRHFLFELRPPLLDRDGLAAAVRQYLRRTGAQTGASVHLDDRLEEEPPSELRAVAYRIVQEALRNVAKHAQAREIHVLIDARDGGLFVEVRDDGVGIGEGELSAETPDHIGMSTMRERAELSGGWMRVESFPGEGTTIDVWLPLEHQGRN